jgi:hypothetical protein
MRVRWGLVAMAVLLGFGGAAVVSDGVAAPARGVMTAATDAATVTEARYVRRHGRTCYRKCYREFVIGRRVCRTYCGPF